MKRYKYYILSLAVLCSFSACDSLLNEDPLYVFLVYTGKRYK